MITYYNLTAISDFQEVQLKAQILMTTLCIRLILFLVRIQKKIVKNKMQWIGVMPVTQIVSAWKIVVVLEPYALMILQVLFSTLILVYGKW